MDGEHGVHMDHAPGRAAKAFELDNVSATILNPDTVAVIVRDRTPPLQAATKNNVLVSALSSQ